MEWMDVRSFGQVCLNRTTVECKYGYKPQLQRRRKRLNRTTVECKLNKIKLIHLTPRHSR